MRGGALPSLSGGGARCAHWADEGEAFSVARNIGKYELVVTFSLFRLRCANAFEPSTGRFDPFRGPLPPLKGEGDRVSGGGVPEHRDSRKNSGSCREPLSRLAAGARPASSATGSAGLATPFRGAIALGASPSALALVVIPSVSPAGCLRTVHRTLRPFQGGHCPWRYSLLPPLNTSGARRRSRPAPGACAP